MRSYEQRLIWVLGITFGVLFFDRNAASFLMPFISPDLGLNNQQVGLIASALSFTWALSAFVGGALSDRTGSRKPVLLVSVLAFSACSFLSGLAGSFAALFAARLLMGLVEGPFMPVSHSLLARESALDKRGHNMGVMQNFGSNLLGSFAQIWNWRTAFFLAGVPGIVMALLIARYVHEPPRSTEPRAGLRIDVAGHLTLLRYRNMLLCVVMSIFMVSWMVLGWVFLPVFYTKARLLSGSEMKVLMSLLGLSAAFFCFIVPGLSDRLGRRPVVVAANLIGLLVPFAVLYFHGSLYVLGVLVFVGWAASGTFPLFMATIPSETVPARYVATAVGLSVGVGEILGGVGAPALAGSAADRYGLTAPLFIQAGCALIGALLALGLRETAPGRATAPATPSPLTT